MATSKKSWKKSRRIQELIGILLLFAALISIMSLISYDQGDATWFSRQADDLARTNWVCWAGATLSEALLQLLGTSAWLVPVFLGIAGWARLRYPNEPFALGTSLGLIGLTLALASLTDLLFRGIIWGGEEFGAGGYLGHLIARMLVSVFNRPGAMVFSGMLVAAVVVLITRASFSRLFDLCAYGVGNVLMMIRNLFSEGDRSFSRPPGDPPEKKEKHRTIPYEGKSESPKLVSKADSRPEPAPAPRRSTARAKQQGLPLDGVHGGGYSLPPLELLKEPEPQQGDNEADLLRRADLLTEKFAEFAVAGKVVAIHPGPVVTTFEFEPDSGVRFSKVTSLVEDLCLALRAVSIRIDRIPGKSTVGIEVPNELQEVIYPKELISSSRFSRSESKLTMALGKDIGGDVFVTELDKMPHLLIAGATGAGKSVGLNGMIASILYKATPEDVRFIMIDTKMIELGIYADIPHLLIPVVTEPKAASTALKWAVREMGKRYKRLAAVGVRNIGQFNELLASEPDRTMLDDRTGEEIALEHLPYIVIIIDEMADLMMVASADVEESVMRLAQMARAVGIHLILATQRPSVDVITGTIKANFPSRIAFRVSQRVDSRTIIDRQGAEHLLGRGDMLFLPPGSARLIRLHGGFITESELNRITSFLKKTAKPEYDEAVLREEKEERGRPGDEERDEFFIKAVEVVLQEGQCSITMIQRRLRLGYARAARIVDAMEQAGIVGPPDGARPREIRVGPEILQQLEASGR